MVVGEITTGTEVLVIGGGPGGYHAAACAARHGKEVTLVEAGDLGGVCLNAGCIPSKALIQGAAAAAPPPWGGTGAPVEFAALQEWKVQVVARLRRGVELLMKQADIKVVQGRATFTGRDRVSVASGHGTEAYRFEHCIIATGSSPTRIPGFETGDGCVIDSTGALALPAVPPRLLVVGGGYIGLELGTAYARLGSQVTVVEALDRLLPTMDPELSRAVHRRLQQLGVQVHTGVRVQGWTERDGAAVVTAEAGGRTLELPADRVLVAVGRRPNSAGLGLELAGVTVDERGFIQTDSACRTAAARIYAIGDVAGNPMLAHKATREAEVCADAIAGLPAAMDAVAIPAVAFTDPEVASVGLTEAEARAAGYTPATGRSALAASGRAWIRGDAGGFVKVVADSESGLLLGVQMAGPEASELIAAAALALEMGARAQDVALTIHPHPTLSESLMAAAAAAAGRVRAG